MTSILLKRDEEFDLGFFPFCFITNIFYLLEGSRNRPFSNTHIEMKVIDDAI